MFLSVTVVCLCLFVFLAVRERSTRRQRVYSKRARQSTESVRQYMSAIFTTFIELRASFCIVF